MVSSNKIKIISSNIIEFQNRKTRIFKKLINTVYRPMVLLTNPNNRQTNHQVVVIVWINYKPRLSAGYDY